MDADGHARLRPWRSVFRRRLLEQPPVPGSRRDHRGHLRGDARSGRGARTMSTQAISILYFTNVRVRGGAEDHILTLLSGLDRNLFRPLLVCPAELARKLQPDIA